MIALSVNVNKIATLRNSRGGDIPDMLTAVDTCVAAGAQGITVHPREDERHIRPADVKDIAERLIEINTQKTPTIEYNIEGDPRPDLIEMVLHTKPTQCTLVPVVAGEITSHTVWDIRKDGDTLKPIIAALNDADIRVSPILAERILKQIARDTRTSVWIESKLYTAPLCDGRKTGIRKLHANFALVGKPQRQKAVDFRAWCPTLGHDLNLDNLPLMQKFTRAP